MASLTVSGGGFEFEIDSADGTWSWQVIANNSGAGSLYSIGNIQSPYGPIIQTMMNIPDDVIGCMCDSIDQLKQQFSPLMSLVSPIPPTFVASVTEGDCAISLGNVVVQNSGAFGSFMNVTATASANWIQVDPVVVNNIPQNQKAIFSLVANPLNLLNANSPYLGTIIFQDNRTPATEITANIILTVNPRPVIQASPTTINLTYYASTQTSGGSKQVTIQNAGPLDSILDVDLAKVGAQTWWNFTPTTLGTLASGASDIITLSVNTATAPCALGTYTDTLRISSKTAANSPVDVKVILTVQ